MRCLRSTPEAMSAATRSPLDREPSSRPQRSRTLPGAIRPTPSPDPVLPVAPEGCPDPLFAQHRYPLVAAGRLDGRVCDIWATSQPSSGEEDSRSSADSAAELLFFEPRLEHQALVVACGIGSAPTVTTVANLPPWR